MMSGHFRVTDTMILSRLQRHGKTAQELGGDLDITTSHLRHRLRGLEREGKAFSAPSNLQRGRGREPELWFRVEADE